MLLTFAASDFRFGLHSIRCDQTLTSTLRGKLKKNSLQGFLDVPLRALHQTLTSILWGEVAVGSHSSCAVFRCFALYLASVLSVFVSTSLWITLFGDASHLRGVFS